MVNRSSISREEMVELYKAGYSCGKIAAKANIGRISVHQSLRNAGIKFRTRSEAAKLMSFKGADLKPKVNARKNSAQITAREMQALYEGGQTSYQISERAGISNKTVCYHLHKLGVKMRRGAAGHAKNTNKSSFSTTKLIADYRNGASLRDLKKTYNISHEYARQILKNQNVPLRRPGGNKEQRVNYTISIPYKKAETVFLVLQALDCYRA